MFIVDFKTGEIKKTGKTHRKYVLKALEDPRKADWQIPFYFWAMTCAKDISRCIPVYGC